MYVVGSRTCGVYLAFQTTQAVSIPCVDKIERSPFHTEVIPRDDFTYSYQSIDITKTWQ